MIKDMETLGAVLVIEERKRSYHIRVIILKLNWIFLIWVICLTYKTYNVFPRHDDGFGEAW